MEICRRLDGLPLAIELAAARIRLLDPVALLARLENVLDALGTGPIDLPERQRSLRATIEWSVSLLDEGGRDLMAALSVFVDGWTVAAAATVAELTEDRALDLLDALAGHSLVGVVATAAGPRFRMLATVREFAGELLDADGRRDRIERRHAEFFRSLVEEVHWPTERQIDWVDRLRVDEENIRAAVQWFFAHDVTAMPHLFRVLWLFWQMGDRMPEGRQWIDQLRLRADELAEGEQAELLFNAAVTAVEVGDDDSALAAVEAIRHWDGQIEDPTLDSALQLAVSWTLPILDDFDGALQAATTALAGLRRSNDPLGSFALLTVGMLEMTLGQDDSARAHLSEVDELGSQFGNNWLESSARTQLAMLAVRSGRLAEADALLAESVRAIRETTADHADGHVRPRRPRPAGAGERRDESGSDGARRRRGSAGTCRPARLADRSAHGARPAWPPLREQMDAEAYRLAFEAGAELPMRDALALISDDEPFPVRPG